MNSSSNNTNNTLFSPYLLSRFHQHLNHLNDMAFTHTKILQEIIEKRSNEPITSSPHGSITSSPSSSSSTTADSNQQRKRSYQEMKNENHLHKRSRKQSKPQQLRQNDQSSTDNDADDDDDDGDKEEEEEIGEINEKQNLPSNPPPAVLPFPPFLQYLQDLTRANELLPLPPPPPTPSSALFSQTIHHHHQPYFSQILFNNSFINQFSSGNRFPHPPTEHPTFPFHFSTPKKRRTKVTDTRLSPRIASKIPSDDLTDDDNSSSDGKSDLQPIEYNGFQITKLMFFYTRYPSSAVLKVYFPDVRFNKVITAQLVKWFSNFREFFYQQIEKSARQYLAEGVRHSEDLVVTSNSELYRALNLHYNRSNQIQVPISFINAVQAALREFFVAIQQEKDMESSWKKSIYKIMQRLDDQIPEFFKNDHWMHSI